MQGQLFTQDFLKRGVIETPPNQALNLPGIQHELDELHELGSTTPDPARRYEERVSQDLRTRVFADIFPQLADDAAYMLDTFPIVREQDLKAFGSYRTKADVLARLALLA